MTPNQQLLPAQFYEAEDLLFLKKAKLIQLMKKQQNCWPVSSIGKLTSKTNKDMLHTALLDPSNNFSMMEP
ncbi:hypothetical protein H0H87_003244 [Tephrocybe sp. NHM501043]|nr:hypothetical protein H0H87_003244 [Tephrocybe sp. NHM501043]